MLLLPARRIVAPRLASKADRPALQPGWDDLPIDRPRPRAGWWRRLLAGAAGNTRLQPGTCCGCGPPLGCGSSGCPIPAEDLTLSYSFTGSGGSGSGAMQFTYYPTAPPGGVPGWYGAQCIKAGATSLVCCAFVMTCGSPPNFEILYLILSSPSACGQCDPPFPFYDAGGCSTISGITVNSLTCGAGFLMHMSAIGCATADWTLTVSV